jgi:hypothetical protein
MPKIEWLYDSDEHDDTVEQVSHALSREQWAAARQPQGVVESETVSSSRTSESGGIVYESLEDGLLRKSSTHGLESSSKSLGSKSSALSLKSQKSLTQSLKSLKDQPRRSSTEPYSRRSLSGGGVDEESGLEFAGHEGPRHTGKRASMIQRQQSGSENQADTTSKSDVERLVCAKDRLDNVAQALETTKDEGINGDITALLAIFSESMGSFNALLTKFEEGKEEARRDRRAARSSKSRSREKD